MQAMLMHRLANVVAALVALAAAMFGVDAGPAHAAQVKCPGSPSCVVSVVALGDCWEKPCSVALRLPSALRQDVTVRYSTVDGTAIDGLDYKGVKDGFATIPAGARVGYLPLTILADDEREPDENFYIKFVSPWDGFAVEPSVTEIVIHDGS